MQVEEQSSYALTQEYQVLPELDDYFMIGEYGTELGPYNVKQPIPFIEDITVDGLLSIGWDRAIKQRDDFEELSPSKVAVRLEDADSESSSRRRNLIYRHEGWYKNQTVTEEVESKEEWLLVLEALELRVVPGEESDSNRLNLTWEVFSISEQRL